MLSCLLLTHFDPSFLLLLIIIIIIIILIIIDLITQPFLALDVKAAELILIHLSIPPSRLQRMYPNVQTSLVCSAKAIRRAALGKHTKLLIKFG